MTIETLLRSRMIDGSGALFALISTGNDAETPRVFPVKLPQAALARGDCVTWQRITETRSSSFGSDTGIVDALIQIDCWAVTFVAARALCQAVRERLQRWRTAGPPVVQDTFIETVTDEYDEDEQIHRVRMEVRLIYPE